LPELAAQAGQQQRAVGLPRGAEERALVGRGQAPEAGAAVGGQQHQALLAGDQPALALLLQAVQVQAARVVQLARQGCQRWPASSVRKAMP
jgi:hypothetical protein